MTFICNNLSLLRQVFIRTKTKTFLKYAKKREPHKLMFHIKYIKQSLKPSCCRLPGVAIKSEVPSQAYAFTPIFSFVKCFTHYKYFAVICPNDTLTNSCQQNDLRSALLSRTNAELLRKQQIESVLKTKQLAHS